MSCLIKNSHLYKYTLLGDLKIDSPSMFLQLNWIDEDAMHKLILTAIAILTFFNKIIY
jgi:hypothetical protein